MQLIHMPYTSEFNR